MVDLPFAEESKPFVISVRRRGEEEPVFSKKFQYAESKYYDTLTASGSFQSDNVWKINSNARPRPEQFERSDRTHDFLTSGKLEVTKGKWTTRFDGEIAGSNDTRKRLRQSDGSKTDITRAIGVLEFRDNSDLVQASIGDITINGGMELVNQGYSSRGVQLLSNWFGERLKVNVGNAFGSDIRGTQHGIDGYRQDNRRTAANVSIDVLRGSDVGLTLLGSWLDVERPSASDFGFGQVADGEENTVYGGGAKLALLDNRIQVKSELAYSEYANPESLNTFNEFGNSVDVGVTTGAAQFHRADVDIWRGDMLTVRGHTSYRLVEPLFQSVQSGQIADRETWDYGVSTTYDFITLTIGRNVFENNVDDINSILKTRQKRDAGSLDFSLSKFREIPAADGNAEDGDKKAAKDGLDLSILRRLIPSSIQLTKSRERVSALNGDVVGANSSINGSEIPDQVTTTDGVTFSWDWSFGSTSLAISESQLDTRQPGRQTADTEDRSLSFDQSFTFGVYSGSFRLGLGEFENNEITTRSQTVRQETGFTVGADLEYLPKITSGLDISRSREFDQVNDQDGYSNSWRVNAVLDFSKFVPKFHEAVAPYVTLNGSIDRTYSRAAGGTDQSTSNYAVSLAFGFRF